MWKAEPIARLRNYMVAEELWSKPDEEALHAECAAEVERAVAAYEATEPEPPSAMFDHLFETLPAPLRAQRETVAASAKAGQGDG
jgi:pyruvate dehydrogenase E1 component alpha subunit